MSKEETKFSPPLTSNNEMSRIVQSIYDDINHIAGGDLSGGPANYSGVTYLQGQRSNSSIISRMNRRLGELNDKAIPELNTKMEELDGELEDLDGGLEDLDDILGNPPDSASFFESIVTNQAWIDNLVANTAWFDKVVANDLFAEKVATKDLFAEKMVAESTLTSELIANTAFISDLFAENIEITGTITNSSKTFAVDSEGFSVQKNSSGGFFPERSYSIKDGSTVIGAFYGDNDGRVAITSENDNDIWINPSTSQNNIKIGIGTLVLPRYNETQRDNWLSQEIGSMIWNSDVNKAEVWDGSMWRDATQNTV